ncbi:hypothetical protein ACFLQJ_00505 [Calditrichota bacterium]
MGIWRPKRKVRNILAAVASGSGTYILIDQLGDLAAAGVILLCIGVLASIPSSLSD